MVSRKFVKCLRLEVLHCRLSTNTWIIILVALCIVTFQIQMFALIRGTDETEEEFDSCIPQVSIKFSDGQNSSAEYLWSQWNSKPGGLKILSSQRHDKNFLTVILPLLPSIDSTLVELINRSSPFDKLHNSVVLLSSSQDSSTNSHSSLFDEDAIRQIIFAFDKEIDVGFLNILQLDKQFDNESALSFQSDVLGSTGDFLVSSSQHCVLIDGRYSPNEHYLRTIRESVIRETKHSRDPWSVLELAASDTEPRLLGKLLRCGDIPKLGIYFSRLASSSDEGFEEKFELLLKLLSQEGRRVVRPPVFRYRVPSSAHRLIAEKYCSGDDPPASVYTNMRHVEDHKPSYVYGSELGYFRAHSPDVGDWLTVIFDRDDVTLDRVCLETGDKSGNRRLVAGSLEASPKLLRVDKESGMPLCADYYPIGDISEGLYEREGLGKSLWGRPTKCLRLTIARTNAGSDIIFSAISIGL